jgi:TetR/AcrR family transcriptional regulator, fatty acid metabolism regulator protein
MPKKVGEKYSAIIEAAVKVFAQYGYHNCQVAKVAKEAGVADGTIYLYFENKEDILISLYREKMGQYIESLELDLEKLSRSDDKLKKLIKRHLNHLEADPSLAEVTQIQLRQSDPIIRQGIAEPVTKYFRLIEQIVILGQEQGVFDSGLDYRLARKMIFGTLDETVTCWVMAGAKKPLSAKGEMIYNLFMRGLS